MSATWCVETQNGARVYVKADRGEVTRAGALVLFNSFEGPEVEHRTVVRIFAPGRWVDVSRYCD